MKILFLTGAGLSANAGLPTYRGPDGVYTNTDFRIEDFLTFKNYKANTDVVRAYMEDMRKKFSGVPPSDWHTYIASLQKDHDVLVVTQNIDGLHQAAGSKNVVELHGNAHNLIIRDGIETPDIVFFGDHISNDIMWHIYRWENNEDIDLCVIVGTSMQFDYLYEIGYMGKKVILVDKDPNHPCASSVDYVYQNITEIATHIKYGLTYV